MHTDIFEFWAQMQPGTKIHPADKATFALMEPERHGFQLQRLPACFIGPLKTAPVVLLYLSPGYEQGEEDSARLKETKDRYFARWQGDAPLPEHHWFIGRTKRFGPFDNVRKKVAVLNIGAYHSNRMNSYASMLALPSSRITLNWAQTVLFPDALQGKRIVVCMRSAAYWGLEPGKKYKGTLFAPKNTRSGHFRNNDENDKLVKLIKQRIA